MPTNLVAKMGQNYLHPCTYRSVNQNGMGYRDLNARANSTYDASISCKNFVNFFRHGEKLAYLDKYLRKYWTDFYNFFHHIKVV